MRRPIVIAATVLACAATAAPARADGMGKDIAYAVRVDGSGTYAYTGSDDVSLRFTYSGSIGDGVVFRNASPFDTTGQDIPVATATGTYGSGCTVDQGFPPAHGRMRFLDADEELVPLDGSVHMWLRPLDALQVQFACPGDEDVHPSVDIALPTADDAYEPDGTVKLGQNPFDIAFDVPRDIIGMGSIQQLDPARTIEGVRCPGYIQDETISCKLQWSAKITLTKLWEKPIAGTTAPPPPPPVLTPDTDDDLLVPLVPNGKAKLRRDASKATLSVTCPAGCTGTATLSAAGRGARASASALARTRFRVSAGATKRVTIKLRPRARRAVRRAGAARIVVRTLSGGRSTTRRLTVRVPRRR